MNRTSSPSVSMRSRAVSLAVPTMHAAFRIIVGLLFAQHGAQKLFGLFGGIDGGGATVSLFSLFGVAGVLEFFGGLAISLGLFTRYVASILATEMVTAYFMVHTAQGALPIENGGELAVLYASAFAFLVAAGPGAWSIDRRLISRGTKARPGTTERRLTTTPERPLGDRPTTGRDRPAAASLPLIGHRRANSADQ